MMFHVGQQVVCVDDKPRPGYSDIAMPVRGLVYTIKWIGYFYVEHRKTVCVELCEIIRPRPVPFIASRFRPVRTTSIEVFERLLTQVPTKEPVT
jgi:hypothetical protein